LRFQNRRTKWRRQEAEEREFHDKETAKLAMLSTHSHMGSAKDCVSVDDWSGSHMLQPH